MTAPEREFPTVEWHTIGEYRVSFDIREDASRFIVLGPPKRSFMGHPRPNLLAQGLIDAWPGMAPRVECDHGTWKMPHDLEVEIARLWLIMRARLRAERGAP